MGQVGVFLDSDALYFNASISLVYQNFLQSFALARIIANMHFYNVLSIISFHVMLVIIAYVVSYVFYSKNNIKSDGL
jgi:hypothetical protein